MNTAYDMKHKARVIAYNVPTSYSCYAMIDIQEKRTCNLIYLSKRHERHHFSDHLISEKSAAWVIGNISIFSCIMSGPYI